MKQSKSKNASQILISVAMYIVVLGVLGIFNFCILSYNGVKLTFYSFWLPTIFTSIMYFLLYTSTANLRYATLENTDKDYVDNELSISRHLPNLIGERFRTHIYNLDFKNKRETWENKIRTKISNHASLMTLKLNYKITNVSENKWDLITRWYVRKRKRLELYLTDEWIKNNLKYKIMFYPRITVSEVLTGRLRNTTRTSMLNRHHLASQVSRRSIWVVLSLIGSAVVATIAIAPNPSWQNILIQLSSMALFSVVNIMSGFLAGNNAHKSRYNTSIERLEIITDYLKVNG